MPATKLLAWLYRIDQLLEQVDQGSQVVAVDPIEIAEDIAVPRRDSDLTAWVKLLCQLPCNAWGLASLRAASWKQYRVSRAIQTVQKASVTG